MIESVLRKSEYLGSGRPRRDEVHTEEQFAGAAKERRERPRNNAGGAEPKPPPPG